MSRTDPEQERRLLAEFYAGQMDGELEKVAGQGYELTEVAREALRAELTKRGLRAVVVEERPAMPPSPEPVGDPPPKLPAEILPSGELDMRQMVTVRRFRDLPEALLAKGSLESAGIECALVDDNLVRLDWFWSNLIGGAKLQVEAEDLEAANDILNQPIPEHFDVAGIGDYQQPRCPKCGSLDVTFKELDRPVSYITAWLHVPIPVYRRAWRCHACNAEWEDDGVPGPAESNA
jgi:hypothetical protein